MHPLALGTAVAFGLLSLLHLYWMAGGRWGMSVVLPERDGRPLFLPGGVAAAVVAALLATAGLLVLECSGLGPGWVPSGLVLPGTGGVAVVMLARALGDFRYLGFFKRVRGTRFAMWDTRLFAPLALLLGLATALVALQAA